MNTSDTMTHETREALAELQTRLARHPYQFELVYVHYDDQLSDEGIAEYLSDEPDWDKVYSPDWESDQRYTRAAEMVAELIIDLELDEDEVDIDELEEWVREHDTSDPLKDLLRNTPDRLLRYTIQSSIDYISGHDEDAYDREMTLVRQYLAGTGLTVTDDELHTLVANGPFDWHEGVTLDLIWYGEVVDVPGATSFTITNPNVLLIDRWNGSGFECQATGTATFPITAEHRVQLDSQTSGYGWDEIAGVVKSYYRTDVTYTRTTPTTEES